MAFSIPTYEIHVRPNHEHASQPGVNSNHVFLFHTSPATPEGSWGGIPVRQLRTSDSWEWWGLYEIKVDPSWNSALEGSQYSLPIDYHNVPGDVGWSSGSGVAAFHLKYEGGALKLQHQPNYPNHVWTVYPNLSKGVWHSILIRLILGRTDGTIPASGHPNGGMGRTRIWIDGNDVPRLDTGNVNNLQRFNSVNQAKMDLLDGNYSQNINQEAISYITAGRWAKTLSEAVADSSITFTGAQVCTIYTGSGTNLGPSSYTAITSRQDTNFLLPPQFGGAPAPGAGVQTGPYGVPIQWNSVVDPGIPPPTVPEMEGPWGDPIQWNSQAAPIPGTGARVFRRFYGPGQLLDAPGDLYTVPSGKRAVIRHIHVSNPGVPSSFPPQSVDFTFSIGTDAAATRLWDGYPIASDDLLQHFRDHALSEGEKIQAYASLSNVLNLTVEGYEESLEAQASTDIYGEGAYGDETYGT